MHWNTLSPEEQEILRAEEEDLEIRALDDGISRFRKQNQEQPMSKWPAARVLITTGTELLTKAIQEEADKVVQGRGMRGGIQWGHIFLYMDPQVLAIATICAIFDALSTGGKEKTTSWQAAINRVALAAQMETHFTILKNEAPRLKAVMERRIKRWESRSLRAAMKQIGGDCTEKWDHKRRLNIGAKLVGMAVEHSGLFEMMSSKKGGKTRKYLVLTPETLDAIMKMNDHLEILTPVTRPMVVPPNDWGPDEKGGYLLLGMYHSIVKTKDTYPSDMPVDHGPLVYGAVNALQQTPWKINRDIHDTMKEIWLTGGGIAGIPVADDYDPLPRSTNCSRGCQCDECKQWRTSASKIYQSNARMVGRRLSLLQTIAIADRFRSRVFYFPYQCDFRGRIYPVPQFLQPQGNDVARGLLTFADGKPLGEKGIRWLFIQYANCWGVDKVSFDEREVWATDKLDPLIGGEIPHPLDMKAFWVDADNPWQALATMLEILRAFQQDDAAGYVSHLPISVDGSNSGLQHFSAMLRDPVGAGLVNLMPSESPSDIYTDVSVSVDRMVREDKAASESGHAPDTIIEDLPTLWLEQGIDRYLCKRGTMTYCYGVTQQGLKDALIVDGFVDWADNQFAAVQYIGKKIWAAIQENITGASEAMDWLRKCAVKANKSDVLLTWRSPSGFHVVHPYREPKETRVRCLSGEATFKVFDPDRAISPHKQRNALPPNFVHSLDASHLIMTVAAGDANDIKHWMMIHDSFGTHACNVDLLRDILREQFVNLYEIDVLEKFREAVIAQTGEDPGPPPPKGDFDLDLVLQSEYIFS